jgi:FlaA1/EpsC-like NDP-sugar epimerase
MSTPQQRAEAASSRRRTLPILPGLAWALDSAAWVVTLLTLTVSRYLLDGASESVVWSSVLNNLLYAAGLAVALTGITGLALGTYRRRYVVGSLDELRALIAMTFGVWVVLSVVIATTVPLPRSVILASFPTALLLMAAGRLALRVAAESRVVPATDATPVLLFGAGEVGRSVIRQMAVSRRCEFRPMGLIDDDPAKKGFVLQGLRVLGSRGDLERLSERTGAEAVVVCLDEADSTLLRELHALTEPLGLRLLVFPSVNEALRPGARARNLRDVSVDDLVGRHPAQIDLSSVASYITGRRVLVTGAGGSIGSELCTQIAKFGPAELFMLDRDESGLHTTQISIFGHGLLDTDDAVLADIRDEEAVRSVFEDLRPEVVFHAAALKHLPMLEQYPAEAWKTNVLGTLNVLKAALAIGVERFVNISTDKAADPTSVLGHSKRMAERLTAWAATQDDGHYVSVRFGNVLGSRGSMLPTFQAQIEKGGPVTVTHPDVTRYFMTIPEACELVVQAGALGQDGQVMILDMGEPVRILDVARRMIQMSGKEIEIVFTGLREGEKLHEDLFSVLEHADREIHPRISHADVESFPPAGLVYETWEADAKDKSKLLSGDAPGTERRSLRAKDEIFHAH